MNKNTAILLFGRSASAEAGCKYFGSPGGSLRVASTLLSRTRRTLRRSGLPLIEIDERRQRGGHFGDRLVDAMSQAFEVGYESLIVVGSDCPDLKIEHINQAARRLSDGAPVLGPDHRGGIWLLGLSRKHFHRERLLGVRWNSDCVYQDLATGLEKYSVLPALADVNDSGDLRIHWHRWKSLLADLAFLWLGVTLRTCGEEALYGVCPLGTLSGRAPPRAA